MPKIILRCNYYKGVPPAQLEHYVWYVGTREGVEYVDGRGLLSSTVKQQRLIAQILTDMPGAKEMLEYADYLAEPNRRNASEFITQALEQNLDMIATRENYVDYIAGRPRVERIGEHGLFTDAGAPVVLTQVQNEVANHKGVLWTHIISLRREDAARLGYDSAAEWMELLRSKKAMLAEHMKISGENLRWYAAFHNESHHPHVHLMVYSANPSEGFLTEKGIEAMRSELAHDIFRQDFAQIYDQQNLSRKALKDDAALTLREKAAALQTGVCMLGAVETDLLLLAGRLKDMKGKKQYAYMPPEAKQIIDRIVDGLTQDERVAAAYAEWYRLRCEILKTYRDELPEAPPLSTQKEFRSIQNHVIAEAVKLGDFHIEIEQEALDSIITEPERDEVPPPEAVDDPVAEFPPGDAGEDAGPDLPEEAGEPSGPYNAEWSDRYRLAREYLFGSDHVEQDFAEAYRLFIAEAGDGNALAMCDLGRMHKDELIPQAEIERAGGEPGPASRWWYAKALAAFMAVEDEKPRPYIEYRIGKLYAAGDGTAQDYSEAAGWFQEAVERNHKYAQYSLAGLYYQGKGVEQNYETAFELYRRSAAQGNPYASYELAKMCRDGIGTDKNESEAGRYFKEAFTGFVDLEKRGRDDKLQYRIGQMLYTGTGTEKDTDAAIGYFEKAAKLGNIHAQYALAKAVLETDSDADRIAEAVEWMRRAAENGSEHAQYALGKFYLAGEHVPKDTAKAVALFEQAAAQGNQYAQYQLGKLYLTGEDVPVDIEKALRWLTASAEQGNQFAQYALGKLYLDGEHAPKDIAKAVALFEQAAAQGNQYAQYQLGRLYLAGEDMPVDIEKALRWLTVSAEQGNQFAQYALGKLYLTGEYVPTDIEKAIQWLTASAEQGNQYAQYQLGKLYLMGRDVPRDREKAEHWLTLSAAQGNEYAQFFLDHIDEIGVRSPVTAVTNLMRALARLFEDQADYLAAYHAQSESKELRKERRKKIAQGHAADDHEPKQTY